MGADGNAMSDDNFVGPELPTLWRRLTASEARDYLRLTGLTADDAALWADASIGPYETARNLNAGRSLADAIADRDARRAQRAEASPLVPSPTVEFTADTATDRASADLNPESALAWRAVDRKIPIDTASDDGLVLEVGAHVLVAEAPDMAKWREADFDPEAAAAWAAAGVDPDRAANLRRQDCDPAAYVRDLAESQPDQIIVWGTWLDECQLATLPDARLAASIAQQTATMLACTSWAELVCAVGRDAVEEEFGSSLNDAWGDLGSGGARPKDWVPSGPLDLAASDWLTDQPRLTDPDFLEIPGAMLDLATASASRVSGTFVSWSRDVLPAASRIARLEGCAFVRAQPLIDAALDSY